MSYYNIDDIVAEEELVSIVMDTSVKGMGFLGNFFFLFFLCFYPNQHNSVNFFFFSLFSASPSKSRRKRFGQRNSSRFTSMVS